MTTSTGGIDLASPNVDGSPRVIDAFLYFNEVQHVRARCDQLPPETIHLLVEGDLTHQGEKRDEESFYRHVAPLLGYRLAHTVVALPEGDDYADNWTRERMQRDALITFIDEAVKPDPDDLILSCDADEIVSRAALPRIFAATEKGPVSLGMKLFYYSFNWADPNPWIFPKAFRYKDMPASFDAFRTDFSVPVVPNTGWHFSWWGGEEMRSTKLSSFSHSELDTPETREAIVRFGDANGRDPHGNALTRTGPEKLPCHIVETLGGHAPPDQDPDLVLSDDG